MILNRYIEDNISFDKISEKFGVIKNKISFKSIFFIILSLTLATQTFITDIPPFVYVLFGVASLFNVPLILVLISSIVPMYFGDMPNVIIAKIFSFFVLFTLITSLLNIEGVSKKYSVYIKYILSFGIIEIVFSLIEGTLITNLFANIGNALIVSILYFIFSAGIYVIINKSNHFISSKEESVAMVIVLASIATVFSGVEIYLFSLSFDGPNLYEMNRLLTTYGRKDSKYEERLQ